MAAQEPVGGRQNLAAAVAPHRGEQHGATEEDERRIAGDRESWRVPPGEVEGQEQQDAEQIAERAAVVEARRVTANAPDVPGQNEHRQAQESECPGGRPHMLAH